MGSLVIMASMSGIEPTQEVKDASKLIKKRKKLYAIFGFNEKQTEIVLVSDGEVVPLVPESDFQEAWEDMTDELPPKDVRYVMYDFPYLALVGGNTVVKSKLCLISWSPDAAKPKVKMPLAASLQSVKDVCSSCQINMQLNDIRDLAYDSILERLGIQRL